MMATSERQAGALSSPAINWNQLDWNSIERSVNRLQVRIAKAVKEQRWNKVKALQHLLTRSFHAKLLAVKRVVSNKGGRTPGIDGIVWKTARDYWQAAHTLQTRGYKAQPLRRIIIPKRNGQFRALGIPTLHDRAMQALYALALKPVAETTGDKHPYGFREKRSLHDAIKQSFIVLARRVAAPWILEADIKACFDRISHDWLLQHIPLSQRMLRQWLKSGYMDREIYYDTEEGTPQGGIISPILANMALDGLEEVIKGRNKPRRKLNVIRYADDFIITAATREILEQEVLPEVKAFLKMRGLTLSEEKTRVSQIHEGFDFLGIHFRKFKHKLIPTPSRDKPKALLKELRVLFRKSHGIPLAGLLSELNSKLRGWAYAHRHVVAKRLFNTLDNEVFKKVCKWLTLEHRNQTWAWIKKRYFYYVGGRNHIGTYYKTKTNPRKWMGLFRMASVPIRRHVKIRSEANPYDPEYREYFVKREKDQRKLRQLDRKLMSMSTMEKAIACV